MTLVFVAQQVFGDETPLRIRPARVLDGRVHVHRERITDAPNLDVLIERIVVAILGQQTDVALAIRHLVLAGGVVGYVGVADVLNMTDDAVEYLCDLDVGVVVGWDDLTRRPVLPLVVGDLLYMLRQLVNSQTRARIDGLPLNRPSGRQYVRRPLPVIVWRAGGKTQVV